jgi:CubicO group peptidase (beta-lactamase class C family)
MTRRSLLALLVPLVLLGPRPAEAQGLPRDEARAVGFDPAKLARVQAMLDDAVAKKVIPGGSALVARNGRVALLAAAGQADIEHDRPYDADTIVRIASMSKPVTSAAVMVLVDEGKVSLDDPVARFLPEFEAMKVLGPDGSPRDAKSPITIKHLLTHTSGLSYRFLNPPRLGPLYVELAVSDGLSETPGTIGDNIKRLARIPLLFEPGERWDYSLATDVLGRVIEVASGQTLDAFLRERLFQPLKMNDTYFLVPPEKRERLAAVYEPAGESASGGIRRARPWNQREALVYSTTFPTWDDTKYYSGGAGLSSTLGDYARFLQMLANRGELDGVRILKPETVDAMTSNQIGEMNLAGNPLGDAFGYGFGVVTERSKGQSPASVGSYSWAGFYSTYFWVDPEKKLVGILFTQMQPGPREPLAATFQKRVYEALADD